jgi:CubicO group peptidase (beta-lactamase class C family)
VLKTLSSEIDDTVPAVRSITVRDLLTFRMGFGSVMAPPNTHPIQRYIREYRIGGDGPFRPARAPATDEWIRALGSLPLIAQPGERWMYQVSADVLGVLIMRVSGMSLGAFMRERIFEPLGMRDTAFHVPEEKRGRLPTCYSFNATTGRFEIYDQPANSDWGAAPLFESASSGLASTLDDFLAFCRMMLDQGRHGRDQLLSRASVELMTSDQMTPDQRAAAFPFLDDCTSWGLGFAVDIRRGEIFQDPGRYWWTGGTGTAAYVDPTEKMIGILLTQRMMGSPEPPRIYNDFLTTTYAAMA